MDFKLLIISGSVKYACCLFMHYLSHLEFLVIDICILVIQVFAESQDYGIHGERVRNACWGYLCQSGSMELKEVSGETINVSLIET